MAVLRRRCGEVTGTLYNDVAPRSSILERGTEGVKFFMHFKSTPVLAPHAVRTAVPNHRFHSLSLEASVESVLRDVSDP